MPDTAIINAVFIGQVRDRWPGQPPSAIGKEAVEGPVRVTRLGLEGDAQADLTVHGGPGKALHLYPSDHYAAWQGELGENPVFAPGGFGENLSTSGWTEEDTCIGDVLRLGSATVAVSQGRQPCWKLAAHAGEETLAYHVRKTLRTGWYLRVIEEGQVAAGDDMTLLERPHPDWTIHRAAAALFNPRAEQADIAALAAMDDLDPSWRDAFAGRLTKPSEA